MSTESKQNFRRRPSMPSGTLANTYINLFSCNYSTGQNDSYGQYVFTLQENQGSVLMTIYQQGSSPIIYLQVSKSLRWTYQNLIYCYFCDAQRNQWLAVFGDGKTAAHVSAVIVCSMKKMKFDDLLHHDLVKTEGRGIAAGDTLQISYFLFQVVGSLVDGCCFSVEQKKIKYSNDAMIAGIYNGIGGMVSGSTRIILIPSSFTGYANGTRDGGVPQSNIVAVVSLHKVRFCEDHQSPGTEQALEVESNIAPPAPPPPSDRSDTDNNESDFVTNDEAKLETMKKIQKLGAKPSAFANSRMPIIPSMPNVQAQDTSSKLAGTRITEESLKRMEQKVTKKIDEVLGDPKTAGIISGVIAFASQLKKKQDESAHLKSVLNDLSKSGAVVTARQVDFARNEVSDLSKKSTQIERNLHAGEVKLAELKKQSGDISKSEECAKKRTKDLIKQMMNGVFNDISELIEPSAKYSGEEVSDKLYDLLRKHSLSVLNDIKAKGIL